MDSLTANAWPLVGIILLVLLACGLAYWLGARFARVRMESKGHEEVEKAILRTTDQLVESEKKFNHLRSRLGLVRGDRVSKPHGGPKNSKTPTT